LENEANIELRRKKLCFSCKEPWEPGHKDMGKDNEYYIEVLSDSDGEEEEGQDQASRMTIWMRSSHMRRLRVGLLPLYQVFLDFTLS